MDYFSHIFERANLQQIRSFLLTGTECAYKEKNRKEQIKEAERTVFNTIKSKFPDISEYEPIMNDIYNYVYKSETAHMEIGLQCGFMIAVQMLGNAN